MVSYKPVQCIALCYMFPRTGLMNEIGVQGFTMSRIHKAAWNCNPEITLKITLNHVKSR